MSARSSRLTIHWCAEGILYTVVLAFILTGAIFREFNLLIILAGMMLGPLLLSLPLVAAGLRAVQVRRDYPEGVGAGETFEVTLEVHNARRKLAVWGTTVSDTGLVAAVDRRAGRSAAQSAAAVPALFFPYIAPGDSATGSYSWSIPRRGKYRLGTLTLVTRMPFGLWRAEMRRETDDELLVYPRLGTLTRDWRRQLSRREMEGQQSVSRQGVVDGDYYGMRDWRAGDSRRWIHWRTSARRNQLTVRQFERHTNRDITVLLDLQAPPTDADRTEAVETLISFAATICADLCRLGNSHVAVGTTGTDPCWLSGAASAGMQREVHHWLALVEPHAADYLPELLRMVSHERRSAEVVLLLTTRTLTLAELSAHPNASGAEYQRLISALRIVTPDEGLMNEVFRMPDVTNAGVSDADQNPPSPPRGDSASRGPAAVEVGT